MAHRKPLGTTCRTTADWDGSPPALHDALVTDAGTWYRIVGIEETASMREALTRRLLPERSYKVKLVLERVEEPRLEERTVVWPDGYVGVAHPFQWYPRRPKAATRRVA